MISIHFQEGSIKWTRATYDVVEAFSVNVLELGVDVVLGCKSECGPADPLDQHSLTPCKEVAGSREGPKESSGPPVTVESACSVNVEGIGGQL